jgi:hypothetical protein
MIKAIRIILLILIIIGIILLLTQKFWVNNFVNFILQYDTALSNPPVNPVACTQEAKLCPDGSAVGRTGPNCEFALCPNVPTLNKSGITGTVTLSPTCPVERIPPDPNCAPKPYSTSINIMKTGSTKIIKTIQSNSQGAFSVDLSPGAYVLQAQGGNTLPRCGEVTVEVKTSKYTTTEISCDTGIR